MKRTILTLLLVAATVSTADAGFLDKLKKLSDPESKESKILSGTTQLISSTQEMDYPTERTIGETLSLESLQRFGTPVKNDRLQEYVTLVGSAVAANSKRSTIPYRFAVLDTDIYNAFAAPGGIVFISRAMLDLLENEAELAAVLAHEVGHVAERHAVRSIKRAQFFEGVGKLTAASLKGDRGKKFESLIGDIQNVLFDKGLDKEMEFEADRAAVETTLRTGYDPRGMLSVLKKLQRVEAKNVKKGSWFSTHPPLEERIARLEAQLSAIPGKRKGVLAASRFTASVKK
ncbi:MAG: hypothetical protein Fur0034_07260 [Desulfuromonadia bacterium]